jgi:hypothetical protein
MSFQPVPDKNKSDKVGVIAMATPNRDRISVWEAADLTGVVIRKISVTSPDVALINMFKGQRVPMIGQLKNGGYVDLRNFEVKKL